MNSPIRLLLFMALGVALIATPALAQSTANGPVKLPPNAAPPVPAPGNPAPPSPTYVPTINLAPSTAPTPPAASSVPSAAPQSSAADEDIHDIRGLISIPYEWLWAAYIVGAIAVAAALYYAWQFFRRRIKAKPKLPHEIALEKLEAARALMNPDTVREYAFTVSEIIRVYIEQRFGEKAARRTTEEFLSDLLQQTNTPLAQHRALLEDFLSHCDLIKFARWGATGSELESMHESARIFILDTRPQPEPAKPAKVAPAPQPELVPAK